MDYESEVADEMLSIFRKGEVGLIALLFRIYKLMGFGSLNIDVPIHI